MSEKLSVVAVGYKIQVPLGHTEGSYPEDILPDLQQKLDRKGLSCVWNEDGLDEEPDRCSVLVSIKSKTLIDSKGEGIIISNDKVKLTPDEDLLLREELSEYQLGPEPQLTLFSYSGWYP